MPEKFRSAAEMPEPSKPSSAIGSGNEADRRLIRALTDCEPLDWARRLNGDLVYLNQRGQKFILADAEIQKLRSATRGRGAEMSEPRRSPSAIGSDSTDAALEKRKPAASPAKKPGLRSAAEMHEPTKTSSAIGSGSAQDKKSDPSKLTAGAVSGDARTEAGSISHQSGQSPIKNTKAEDTSSLVYPEGSE